MYTPLFIKTNNSLLTSIIKNNELIDYALKNNIKCLSITDTNMYGVMDFYNECLSKGIKPIIGLEICYKEMNIVLYAKNYDGYLELVKLSTLVSSNTIKLDKSLNIICIVPYQSLKLYNELKLLYSNIFVGYSDIVERTKLNGNNLVYMNETLCLIKQDESYLKYLYGIKNNCILENIDIKFENKYLHLEEEVKKNYPMDLNNNYKITELCNVEIKFGNDLLPIYDKDKNSYELLKKLCIEGLKRIFGNSVSKEYQERLKYELDVINKMGFCDYFLVVWDYVKYAKDHDILVGPGRGSAAGSLVSYCLNITTIDPIKYDLVFERFLNPERITMPDIDVDFENTRRGEVVDYCIKKYGIKRVAPIITFGTLGAKQAIRDVSRVMNIDIKLVDVVCKKVDSKLSLKDNFSKIKQDLEFNPELKEMYKVALKLEGIKRHTSIHAAGVVICKEDLDNIIPLDKDHDFYTTGYDMNYLEKLGLLKMDFLVLRNLTLINNILNDIGIKFDDIPLDDKKAIEVFNKVDTIGIFQFESTGVMNFLRKLKVENFTDIYNALALYRPGPMDSIDSFIARRQGKEEINYIVPELKSVLESTYGIMIYQEQIMKSAQIIANYSLGEADLLRRAISKKKEDVLIKERSKFITRSIQNGYSEDSANKVYDTILKFASFGFNKAHSVAYAMVSYKMAYLKANYPHVFFKNLLSIVMGDEIKTKSYIYECKKYGVNIIKPTINSGNIDYMIQGTDIVYPISNIKGIGQGVASTIVEEHKKGNFTSIFNFFERCHLTNKNIENLALSGALDGFGYSEKTIINNIDVLQNYGEVTEYLDSEYALKPELIISDEFSKKEKMFNELEMFGLYLSNHPVTEYRLKEHAIALKDVPNYFDKFVKVVVCIDRINTTKSLKPTCFLTGSDEIDVIDLVLFNSTYEKYKIINKGDIILVEGRVQKRFDKYQIIVDKLKVLE